METPLSSGRVVARVHSLAGLGGPLSNPDPRVVALSAGLVMALFAAAGVSVWRKESREGQLVLVIARVVIGGLFVAASRAYGTPGVQDCLGAPRCGP